MTTSELNPKNYRRIFWINCLLALPLIALFAWPYIAFSHLLTIPPIIFYPGALFFSLPFALTILHGHVTLALGSVHRPHYYSWLGEHPLTYGLLFHPVLISTRFRLVVFTISIIVFLIGWLINL